MDAIKLSLPRCILKLSEYRNEHVHELVSLMNINGQVSGILLGGSLSYKTDIEKSDVDLFCLINDVKKFEDKLHETLSKLKDIDEIIFQGNFPWTEKLYTIFFKEDIDFSIDLCLINIENVESFFWEPDGAIVFDKANMIYQCRSKQINSPNFTRQPFLKKNPFSLSVITLKKIEKNLSRNHLWNALEQVNTLRRFIMQVIRLEVLKDKDFLGRVDRDIEDIIPAEINYQLSKTVALYSPKDIAEKAILLADLFIQKQKYLLESGERQFENWILKQVEHEKKKLALYL